MNWQSEKKLTWGKPVTYYRKEIPGGYELRVSVPRGREKKHVSVYKDELTVYSKSHDTQAEAFADAESFNPVGNKERKLALALKSYDADRQRLEREREHIREILERY